MKSILIEQTCSQDFLTQIGELIEEKLKAMASSKAKEVKEEVLTISQTAKFLGVSRTTLYNYEKANILAPKRFGNTTRYLKSDVVEFLKNEC